MPKYSFELKWKLDGFVDGDDDDEAREEVMRIADAIASIGTRPKILRLDSWSVTLVEERK